MRLVTKEVSLGTVHPGIIWESVVTSPDCRHVAYVAILADDRQAVVVDGKEGKPYFGFGVGSLTFSPDSQRLAYWADLGYQEAWRVVIDAEEGKTITSRRQVASASVRTAGASHFLRAAATSG